MIEWLDAQADAEGPFFLGKQVRAGFRVWSSEPANEWLDAPADAEGPVFLGEQAPGFRIYNLRAAVRCFAVILAFLRQRSASCDPPPRLLSGRQVRSPL